MKQQQLKTHRELVTQRPPHNAMEGGVFGRADIFENDMDIFFSKHWIVVGVTAQIPQPGDSSTVEVGKHSITLVRDDQLNVTAFHTISKDCAPELRSLIPVAVRVVGAHVMVCLGENPPSDIDYLSEQMAARFAPYDLANTRIAHETDIIENGNWKLVIENNRECYHCAAGHPELNVSFLPLEDFSENPEERQELEALKAKCGIIEQSWEREGLVSDAIEYLEEDAVTQFRSQRLVIAGHGESQTLDTQVACTRLFGNLTRRDLGDTHFWTHNSWTHVMSDHAVISFLIPLAPGKTLVRSKWLVHKDAIEGRDYDLKRLTAVWIATNQQDATLVGITHSGTQDPAYVPGPFSPVVETYVDQFTRWYAARVTAHWV
ncbi:MAG: SRPBCC family protein [Pseudomonadota bacterium]